jgi:hypothetical protein
MQPQQIIHMTKHVDVMVGSDPADGVYFDSNESGPSPVRWDEIPALIAALEEAYSRRQAEIVVVNNGLSASYIRHADAPAQSQADGVVAAQLLQQHNTDAPGDLG